MNINEIFYSIQGESSYVGVPTVFVRFTGCSLRCNWCDTQKAYYNGSDLTASQIIKKIEGFQCKIVQITGGEPLDQSDFVILVKLLRDRGYDVSVETSGAKDTSVIPEGVRVVMDLKCPGSGMSENMDWENLSRLKDIDEIKFVVENREDYQWAIGVMDKYGLSGNNIFFSPVHEKMDARQLAEWMLADKLQARLQVQMHKLLGLK